MFRGKEFLSYDLSQTGGEPIVSAQDSVTFYFKTRQASGLLFYTGMYLYLKCSKNISYITCLQKGCASIIFIIILVKEF